MVKRLTSENYDAFVREKQAAAVHFDAEWDVGYRPIARKKMEQAEAVLSEQANFGEIDCDRDGKLVKSIRVLNVPAIAYYFNNTLVAVLIVFQQNVLGRLERLLRGEPVGYKDGMDSS